VLEVGTGSGYQAAVLAEIGCRVHTVEIFAELADSARRRLERLGYAAVQVRHGDGHFGWPEAAPFDAIIVTAAAGYVPPALVEQLRPGGRMVIPVGSVYGVQNLILVEKGEKQEIRTRQLLPVRFVPLLSGLR
jgi:protein-L-isoaspartate(D-aspartate) O-methyltransferase